MKFSILSLFFILFLSPLGFSQSETSTELNNQIDDQYLVHLRMRLERVYMNPQRVGFSKEEYREITKRYDIKKITSVLRNDPGIEEEYRETILQIFKFFVKLNIKKINLSGPGGELSSAYPLALLVSLMDISVNIPKDKICASACSFIYHHSRNKTMEEGSQLVYHLPSIYVGKDMFHIKECDLLNLDACEISESKKFVLKKYKKFIMMLPETIREDVLGRKDSYVDKEEAIQLNLIPKP